MASLNHKNFLKIFNVSFGGQFSDFSCLTTYSLAGGHRGFGDKFLFPFSGLKVSTH
jgi:hypothetical protein